jgi:thiamine biosynthesis lipoprotein
MLLGRYAFRAMGSPCELRLYGASRAAIDAVADAARALVERLEQKYSRYREDSVLSAINRSAGDPAGVVVDDETALLLDYAATAHAESGGLFDATSGSLRRVWDLRSGRVPEQAEITAQLERVGWHRVRWERPRFAMPVAGMELDFGGFVKEYAVDLVADLCRAHGVHSGMVDLGGDLHAIGPHPSGKPWITGIRDPEHPERAIASVGLMRAALATSGDYERCMIVDGVRYTHILDPHTGWPITGGLRSASVIASASPTRSAANGSEGWSNGCANDQRIRRRTGCQSYLSASTFSQKSMRRTNTVARLASPNCSTTNHQKFPGSGLCWEVKP